jgi:hypothetical protein
MGLPCGTIVRDNMCIQRLGGGNVRERDILEEPDVDRRMILKWNFQELVWGTDWIDVA